MKLAIAVMIIILISVISAETYDVGNYSVSFNESKQHVIEKNNYDLTVKTFDGYVFIIPHSGEVAGDEMHPVDVVPVGDKNEELYIAHPSAPGGVGQYAIFSKNCSVHSTMNLTDTTDFLKTLRVEPIKVS